MLTDKGVMVGNYHANVDQAWSYSTCIRATTADGIIVVNRTKYSATTTKHQKLDAALWRGKPRFIILNGEVPKGSMPSDLFERASEMLASMRNGGPC